MTAAIQTLPPGLADLPPGPALVTALAGVDPTRLCHDDSLTFLDAQQRQESNQLGGKLAALVEAGRRAPGPPGQLRRLAYPSQWADGEIAALTGGGPGAVPAGLSSWAPVLADIAARYADRERLLAQLDARPGDRFPYTGLDRFLRMRDRTCVAPCCRRSATACQIDHTLDYAEGGPTTRANTAALCPSKHLRKTAGAWKVCQTDPASSNGPAHSAASTAPGPNPWIRQHLRPTTRTATVLTHRPKAGMGVSRRRCGSG
jgi:hypothetical protein